jgi:lysophospholipase L1-like esterase
LPRSPSRSSSCSCSRWKPSRGCPQTISRRSTFLSAPQQRAQLSDRQQAGIFEADPLLLWRLRPGLRRVIWDFTVVSTNAQGLRYDGEVGAKEPGAWRIVCLGDSVTFGYRAPVVWPDRPDNYDPQWLPYPALVEGRLRAANPGRRVEVIPLAVPGYTSHQGAAWLRREIGALRPDLVVACFGWNDVSMSDRPDRETVRTDWATVTARRALFRSQTLLHLLRWLRAKRQPTAAPPVVPVPRVSREEYVANLLQMARAARRHQAAVLVIGPVYRDRLSNPSEAERMSGYRAAAREAMREADVPYLEIAELTENAYPANLAVFGELVHPNHLGYRLMADSVLAFIRSRRLLTGINIPPAR